MDNFRKISQDAIRDEWEEIQDAKNEPARFKTLYDRYYEPVFRFVYKRTADEVLCRELCSNIFLKALSGLPNYQFRGVPYSALLFRIASNEIHQHFRDSKKQRIVTLDKADISNLIQATETEEEPDFQRTLIEALDLLPPADLEILELRFFESRPFREIAEILQISEGNAKVRTYRIIERMKKSILLEKKQP